MTLTVFPRFQQTQPLLTKVNMALLTIDILPSVYHSRK
jgi:hypothetical protein